MKIGKRRSLVGKGHGIGWNSHCLFVCFFLSKKFQLGQVFFQKKYLQYPQGLYWRKSSQQLKGDLILDVRVFDDMHTIDVSYTYILL